MNDLLSNDACTVHERELGNKQWASYQLNNDANFRQGLGPVVNQQQRTVTTGFRNIPLEGQLQRYDNQVLSKCVTYELGAQNQLLQQGVAQGATPSPVQSLAMSSASGQQLGPAKAAIYGSDWNSSVPAQQGSANCVLTGLEPQWTRVAGRVANADQFLQSDLAYGQYPFAAGLPNNEAPVNQLVDFSAMAGINTTLASASEYEAKQRQQIMNKRAYEAQVRQQLRANPTFQPAYAQ
jgi:hypothetical protein